MANLSLEKLSNGIAFFDGYCAEVEIEFVSSTQQEIAQFLDKYDSVQLVSAWTNTFLMKVYGSGKKEVEQICAIMQEDYNVLSVEIVSLSEV
jgi:ERCC4-type nuclease